MEIRRYCGKERLSRSERLWRRLARTVGFSGTLEVFGYGVKGQPGAQQRREMRGLHEGLITYADYGPGLIRVWMPCACAAAEFDRDILEAKWADPLAAFAHELGHFVIEKRGKKYLPWVEERVAERYGRWLLRHHA